MRIIITGGAGFIGSHLGDALISAGHSVMIIDDFSTGNLSNINKCAEFQDINILRPKLDEIFSLFKPEIVFHLAAVASINSSLQSPASTSTINYVGAVNVFEAAWWARARKVIFTSSYAVYGVPEKLPIDGSHSVKPVSPYGVDKFAAEEYLKYLNRAYAQDYAIIRFANVYGSRQHPIHGGIIAKFCAAIITGKHPVIDGTGEQKRDFLYVSDAVRALILAMDSKEKARTFNIGTGIGTSIKEIYERIACEFMVKGLKRSAEYRENNPPGIKDIWLSHGRAHISLGWSPKVGLEEGIRQTANSFKKEVKMV